MRKQIVLSLWCLAVFVACNPQPERVKPRITSITHSVYASGVVKAVDAYFVNATVTGVAGNILVKEGDLVKKGDTLLQIDDRVSELNVDNAELALQLSKKIAQDRSERLSQLEEQISVNREQLFQDSLMFARRQRLWDQNIGTKQQLEQSKLKYDASVAAYNNSLSQYQQVKDELETAYKRSKNDAAASKELLKNYTIVSELTGKVYDLNIDYGELITPQKELALIGRADSFEIELSVDEQDIVQVEPGQQVLITLDSYKDEAFEARVKQIKPVLNRSSRGFTVICSFVDQPKVLYPNLNLEANIVIETRENVLVIPRDYMVNDSTVLINKGKDAVQVETGIMDYRNVEIRSGLDTNTYIYQPE